MSSSLDALLQQKLSELQSKNLLKTPRSSFGLVDFGSNDYFSLRKRPEILEAAAKALEHGSGGVASRLAGGESPLYAKLESAVACAKKRESACVFGSGYLANIGVIQALTGKGDLVLADRLSHACLIDGAKLSGAKLLRFTHNSVKNLAALLEKHREKHRHCLVITETVFSMDGDKAPVAELAALARRHDAWLLADDAHGLFMDEGSGADILTGTLSKSLASYGGYVAGSKALADYLKTAARSLVFSTALPPASLAAAAKALEIIAALPEIRLKPLENAGFFASLLGLPAPESAILPIILKDEKKTLLASKTLAENGFFVPAIRPPTVPPHTSRLRISFQSGNKREDLERLAELCYSLIS